MKAVIDANAFFSSLLKDGISRRLLFSPKIRFFAPTYLVDELKEHYAEILGKAKIPRKEFDELILLALKRVTLVPESELGPYFRVALHLTPDYDDSPYLACALCVDAIIWSNDRQLKSQARVRVLNTPQLANELIVP